MSEYTYLIKDSMVSCKESLFKNPLRSGSTVNLLGDPGQLISIPGFNIYMY